MRQLNKSYVLFLQILKYWQPPAPFALTRAVTRGFGFLALVDSCSSKN